MTYKSLFILGRQPAIGRAELESVLGAEHVWPLGERAMASDVPLEQISFRRLGGSLRLAKPLQVLDTTNWPKIAQLLAGQLPGHSTSLPGGKLKLGLSVFGLTVNPKQLFAAGLTLKKVCREAGRSVRLVPNTEVELSSAQVLHNQLTGELGLELLCIRGSRQTYLAQTVAVQDIEAYAARDQGRPKRDARVGMLPPKLAQIIVNLSVAQHQPSVQFTVLDPFCGTGVVLQEAMLMGYSVIGSDLDPRMGEYTTANLDWLWQAFPQTEKVGRSWQLGDAASMTWETSEFVEKDGKIIDARRIPATIDAVASETYLGRPLSSWPEGKILQRIIGACDVIIEKFLRNIHQQIKPNTRLCLAVPAWQAPNGQLHHLPMLDRLEKIGYNRVSFEHATVSDLVYSRPTQLVARELLVITRK